MIFRTYVPKLPLGNFVEKMWFCEGYAPRHSMERVLPDGSVQLVLSLKSEVTRLYDRIDIKRFEVLRGPVVAGAHSQFVVLDTAEQESAIGVHFKPGGAYPFMGMPLDELQNLHVPLDALRGSQATDLRERLLESPTPDAKFKVLEQTLYDWLVMAPRQQTELLRYALRCFQCAPTVPTIASVIQETGISKRHFVHLFRTHVGLTPKLFCRIKRFQRALTHIEMARRLRWADVAVDCGYYDQAHFIHDFTSFAGVSPSAYLSGRTEHRNHVRVSK